MIVYVESNFIIETAYEQEQADACEEIIALAEAKKIVLAMPAFCLAEPYETSAHSVKARRALTERLNVEIRELSRSRAYQVVVTQFQGIGQFLVDSADEQKSRLDTTIQRMFHCATVIPLDQAAISHGFNIRAIHSLSPQDALIYGSIRESMQTESERA